MLYLDVTLLRSYKSRQMFVYILEIYINGCEFILEEAHYHLVLIF